MEGAKRCGALGSINRAPDSHKHATATCTLVGFVPFQEPISHDLPDQGTAYFGRNRPGVGPLNERRNLRVLGPPTPVDSCSMSVNGDAENQTWDTVGPALLMI